MVSEELIGFLKTVDLDENVNPVVQRDFESTHLEFPKAVRETMASLEATDKRWGENGSASFVYFDTKQRMCGVTAYPIKGGFRVIVEIEESW